MLSRTGIFVPARVLSAYTSTCTVAAATVTTRSPSVRVPLRQPLKLCLTLRLHPYIDSRERDLCFSPVGLYSTYSAFSDLRAPNFMQASSCTCRSSALSYVVFVHADSRRPSPLPSLPALPCLRPQHAPSGKDASSARARPFAPCTLHTFRQLFLKLASRSWKARRCRARVHLERRHRHQNAVSIFRRISGDVEQPERRQCCACSACL